MAAITAAELLHGVPRLRASKRKVRAEAVVETLLSSIPVISFDLICAHGVPREAHFDNTPASELSARVAGSPWVPTIS